MVDDALIALYHTALKHSARLKQKKRWFWQKKTKEIEIEALKPKDPRWHGSKKLNEPGVRVLFMVSPWEHYFGWETKLASGRWYECSYLIEPQTYTESKNS